MEGKILKTILGKLVNMNNLEIRISDTDKPECIAEVIYVDYHKLPDLLSQKNIVITTYLKDIKQIYDSYPHIQNVGILVAVGDTRRDTFIKKIIQNNNNNSVKFPIICKSKESDVDNLSLIMLNKNRHYYVKFNNTIDHFTNVKKYDIKFSDKKSTILWRGTTTGVNHNINGTLVTKRHLLVSKYYSFDKEKIDVGFNYICQKDPQSIEKYKKLLKKTMTIQQMLQYKYLLSIEGNDVATDLKWKLASNSLVIMPKPTCISIICENLLQPWVHYVPVNDDFSNLEEIYEWCINNDEKCQQIIKNANDYIKIFTEEFMLKLSAKVIETYGNKVKIIKQ